MKFINIIIFISLALITIQRITKKNAYLKSANSMTSKKSSTKNLFTNRDILAKPYGGDIYVNDNFKVTAFLRGYDLTYNNPQGLGFRTDNNADIQDAGLNQLMVRFSAGMYYIPWRIIWNIRVEDPWT